MDRFHKANLTYQLETSTQQRSLFLSYLNCHYFESLSNTAISLYKVLVSYGTQAQNRPQDCALGGIRILFLHENDNNIKDDTNLKQIYKIKHRISKKPNFPSHSRLFLSLHTGFLGC